MADAKSTTSTASSGKRKRNTPVAFYAVKVGRVPGIYQTWDEASQQIHGFANPQYKKFGTLTEAEAMMRGAATSTPKSAKPKFYGVAAGRVPGVYTDYEAVKAQITGFSGGKQKGFATHAEAQAYVDEHKRAASRPISLRGDLSETSSLAAGTAPKKQKRENIMPKPALTNGDIKYEPGFGPLPPDAEDGFDRTIKLDPTSGIIRAKTEDELGATRAQPTGDFSGPIVVYTDGSALGNGKVGAVAGVGVYFGPNDPHNISEALRGKRQTNQRAELVAVARALDHIPIDRETLIVTDSYYSIKCLTDWFIKWEANNWKTASGKDVENKDLIEPIIARIRERNMCKADTKFEWVKGHNNDPGNVAADALAVQGSRTSTPDLRNAPEFSVTLNTPTRSHYFTHSTKQEQKQEHSADGEFGEDDEDYNEAFHEVEADMSSKASRQDGVPPVVAAKNLAVAGAKEGLEQRAEISSGLAPVNGPDTMDLVQDSIEQI